MADPKKISELTDLTSLDSADSVPIYDDSAATPATKNKRFTLSTLLTWVSTNLSFKSLVDDTSPQLGGFLDANGNQIRAAKGADVASSSTLTLGNDGNYFVVTGTTGITAIATKGVGTKVSLRFAASLTLTHHATDLILPSGASITTAAGDVAVFREYATGDWVCESYQRASGHALMGAALTNPMTTLGDLITGGAAGAPARLAVGSEGQVVKVVSGVPAWASGGGLDNLVEDTSPQLGGALDANGHQIREAKGVDVASAGALALGDDGNYFVVTGTTAITSIGTKGVGTRVSLRFADALTLTHHATDLILPTGANITTAAGDVAVFREYATGDWVCEVYQRASGAALVGSGIANLVEDTTPQLGGPLDANGHQIREAKGVDVASASSLTLGDDGNYFVVTGTTAITSIATKGVGTRVSLRFAGILTLTHHATDLILPTGANITTAAGDVAVMREYASGDWVCEVYQRASGAALVGSTFDPASPGAIGGTTPAAGTFTTGTFGGDVIPSATNTYNCGASGTRWQFVYSTYFSASGFFIAPEFRVGASNEVGLYALANGEMYFGGPVTAFNKLQLGANHASTATAQRVQAHSITSGNVNGPDLTVAGGAGSGTGTQGDVILEGEEVNLDATTRIVAQAPIQLKSYTYDTVPAPASHTGALIVVSNAGDDTGGLDPGHSYAAAVSDGTYFRYVADGGLVGGV